MKRIGILYDKESKKVFLLPEQVKELTSKGVTVNVLTGVGNPLKIDDTAYLSAGAKIFEQWSSVVEASDIILKTNSFLKKELEDMNGKIAITMVNYLANVDMLYHMLENNVTGLEWCGLTNRNGYVFFPKIEDLKAKFILRQVKLALAKGLAKKDKHKVTYPAHPKMLILNATFCGVALAKLALKEGYEVTIADADEKYLAELKDNNANLKIMPAHYDLLVEEIKDKNIFVNTAINPTDLTKLRITKEMGLSMPKGSMLIDASCENGYAFHFIKKFADAELKWNNVNNKFYYLVPADMTDHFADETSRLISNMSVEYLLDIATNGVKNSDIWKITNCQDGKVLNAAINRKLRLY